MSRSAVLLVSALVISLSAGCGDDSGPDAASSPPITAQSAGTPQPTPSQSPVASLVPDACTLISSAELSDLLGSEQGNGSTQSVMADRSVCFYEAGTITAVEIADNYEPSRAIIENDPSRTVTDVTGVGDDAFFDDLGGVGQLVAKGEHYFVAVTFVYESPQAGIETGRQIAARMLTAAEG
ncbi:MAG TPA: hypothetical protein VKG85_12030 [Actinomycetes bacterium]|nr:hypothetical protein [Actinomycetes bacterium]